MPPEPRTHPPGVDRHVGPDGRRSNEDRSIATDTLECFSDTSEGVPGSMKEGKESARKETKPDPMKSCSCSETSLHVFLRQAKYGIPRNSYLIIRQEKYIKQPKMVYL